MQLGMICFVIFCIQSHLKDIVEHDYYDNLFQNKLKNIWLHYCSYTCVEEILFSMHAFKNSKCILIVIKLKCIVEIYFGKTLF